MAGKTVQFTPLRPDRMRDKRDFFLYRYINDDHSKRAPILVY